MSLLGQFRSIGSVLYPCWSEMDDRERDPVINLEALDHRGPAEPRPESKLGIAFQRLGSRALPLSLGAWVVFVVIAVAVKASGLPTGHNNSSVQRLVIGGLAAIVGAIAFALAIRSKQLDHEEGTEPSSVLGVSWSTRFLLAGGGFMVLGTALFWSVR